MAFKYFALVGYNTAYGNSTYAITRMVKLGTALRGFDSFRGIEDRFTRNYYLTETGEVDLSGEGEKTFVKELWIRFYAPTQLVAPIVLVQIMDQHGQWWRDWKSSLSFELTENSCTVIGPNVVSNKIGVGDGTTTTFSVDPLDPRKIHTVKVGCLSASSPNWGFSYDLPNKTITLDEAPPEGFDVKIYWPEDPEVGSGTRIGYYDFIESPEGFHGIRGFIDYQHLALNWYPSTDCTGYLRMGIPIPSGDTREVMVPLNQVLYTPRFRIILIPRDSIHTGPEIKITGLNFVCEGTE